MTIYELLKWLRTRAELSQSELSRRTGIPQRYISRWETGKGRPLWDDYVAFANALGVSLDEMQAMCEEGNSDV